jgi:hypothetical protein
MTTEIEIGKEYECVDAYGMGDYSMKYLGIGGLYVTLNREEYYPIYGEKYYVFSTEKVGMYKYAACLPIYKDLKFTGQFKIKKAGNDLDHLFVNFDQPLFVLNGADKVVRSNFPSKYEENLSNNGRYGRSY